MGSLRSIYLQGANLMGPLPDLFSRQAAIHRHSHVLLLCACPVRASRMLAGCPAICNPLIRQSIQPDSLYCVRKAC